MNTKKWCSWNKRTLQIFSKIVSVAAYSERTQTTNLHITSKVTGKVTSCFTRENFVKQAYENERAVVVD